MTIESDIKSLMIDITNYQEYIPVGLDDFVDLSKKLNSSFNHIGINFFINHLLVKQTPEVKLHKYVYQLIAENTSNTRHKQIALVEALFYVGQYLIIITLPGGTMPLWCHSKDELEKGVMSLLSAKECVWQIKSVTDGY
jgi:hypothetical protein